MKELRYTLLSDGSSDRALLPLLTWLLGQHLTDCAFQPSWADLQRLPRPPKTLAQRIERSLELYPCELLFVHRDAENESHAKRIDEINKAVREVEKSRGSFTTVRIVPIHMLEAWLLFDEAALRTAAANPHGHQPLQLPPLNELELIPNPKMLLHNIIRKASGLGEHRKGKLRMGPVVHRIAEVIDDFSPLRALQAFHITLPVVKTNNRAK